MTCAIAVKNFLKVHKIWFRLNCAQKCKILCCFLAQFWQYLPIFVLSYDIRSIVMVLLLCANELEYSFRIL